MNEKPVKLPFFVAAAAVDLSDLFGELELLVLLLGVRCVF